MIAVHRLDGTEVWLNVLLVEYVHATPDTMVVLTNGHLFTVRETPEVVRQQVEQALRRAMAPT